MVFSHHLAPCRLIPARAGNILLGLLGHYRFPAHPRSRGEHSGRLRRRIISTGSSPLARGTFHLLGLTRCRFRLIPARAGNILSLGHTHSFTSAHPRSRGEHQHLKILSLMAGGSSPLARGTYLSSHTHFLCRRLIPARAGNIHVFVHRIQGKSAHPRSRGEHIGPFQASLRFVGSSPLARGTFFVSDILTPFLRLIPARAGNMRASPRCSKTRPAHPRSRGEHTGSISSSGLKYGSSPLARGTWAFRESLLKLSRLIPARAGNMFGHANHGSASSAHPRSRGEHGRL